jgi:hypothetical protein
LKLPLGVASGLVVGLLVTLALAGRLFGQEPRSAWICGDTRFTQLVPRGRSVVGAPVSPPPGCAP